MNVETPIPSWTYGISLTGCQLILQGGYWRILPSSIPGSTPIDSLLDEVKRAVDARLYHLALVLALTLPDICGALGSENGRSGPRQYKAWYNANLKKKFGAMSDDDCYSLRCGVLHQGQFGLAGSRFNRVLFVPPESYTQVHNCIMNDALVFSVTSFCEDIIESTRDWFAVAQADKIVQRNLPNLIRLRPSGIAPYMVGMPVIG